MTKTQTKLVEAAKRHGGRYSVETGRGRGPQGGHVSYGNRERDALFALVDSGVAEITERIPSYEMTGNGNIVRGNVFSFKLLEDI